eukprot:COSAG04_NODE_24835_length_316_cov_0.746544_2_plen_22_part_01
MWAPRRLSGRGQRFAFVAGRLR